MPKADDTSNLVYTTPAFGRLGLFSELSYLKANPKKVNFDCRGPGKNMFPGAGHSKAATNDGYFTPFVRTFEGEVYRDLLSRMRRQKMKESAKRRDGPFRSMCGPKSMNGRGMLWGTFMDGYKTISPLTRPVKKVKENRGIYTNPGKKGTGYGYANVGFDKFPEFMAGKAKKEKQIQLSPFLRDRTAFYNKVRIEPYFGPDPYVPDKIIPTYNTKEPRKIHVKPFYPTSPGKLPGNYHDGCFDKHPEWMADPPVKPKRQSGKNVFIPVSGSKSVRTDSVFRQYVRKQVNPKNWNSVVPVQQVIPAGL